MKRAARFVCSFVLIGACANDFDALTSGTSAARDDPGSGSSASSTSGSTSSTGSTSGAATTEPPSCSSKSCQPVVGDKNGGELISADGCCAFATACTHPFSCSVQCSNGAACTGKCEDDNSCDFRVTGGTGDFSCGTEDCTLACNEGSSCTLDCTQSDSCDVTCDAKSTCVVHNCGAFCDVTCGDGSKAQDCGNRTRACGGCPK